MQRVLRRLLLSAVTSVLAAFAAAPPVAAQGTGAIEGRVVGVGTARPLGDVQVSVMGTTLGARTDDAGRFRIANVPPGTHRVRAQRIGFTSVTNPVTGTKLEPWSWSMAAEWFGSCAPGRESCSAAKAAPWPDPESAFADALGSA